MVDPDGMSATASSALLYSFFKPCVSFLAAREVAKPLLSGPATRASVLMRKAVDAMLGDERAGERGECTRLKARRRSEDVKKSEIIVEGLLRSCISAGFP